MAEIIDVEFEQNLLHDAQAESDRRLRLLRRTYDWFRANYSYIYEDKDTMRLWGDIDSELAEELEDAEKES